MASPEEQFHHIPPMPPPEAGHWDLRPGTVTAAAVLWIIDGVLVTLAFGFRALTAFGTDGDVVTGTVAAAFAVGGAFIWRFGNRLRYGQDNRAALNVLGALSGLTIILLPLVVSAIALQYGSASRRWFALAPAREP
jgi:hypothetical protein